MRVVMSLMFPLQHHYDDFDSSQLATTSLELHKNELSSVCFLTNEEEIPIDVTCQYLKREASR